MAGVTLLMETPEIVSLAGHTIAALVCGWIVLESYRWIRRRSEVAGAIVAITILARVALGLALFWISYLKLPIAQPLQAKGGFWQLAPDAIGYYQIAARAAETHTLVPFDSPSQFFGNTLALWMIAVGVSPAAGMFLNLCLYLALVVMVVRSFGPVNDWRRDLPCIVGVGAYSFSPVILLNSTQSLKDELVSVLVAMACLGVLALRRLIYRPSTPARFWAPGIGVITVAIAIFGIAGVRWYFAFIIWGALALLLAILAVRGRTTPLPRYLVGSVTVLLAGWLGIWGGAGHHAVFWRLGATATSRGIAEEIAAVPSSVATFAQTSRTGFLTSGGATNIVVSVQGGPRSIPSATRAVGVRPPATSIPATSIPAASIPTASARPEAMRAIPRTVPEHATAIATGLAIVFVPISLVQAVSVIDITGGRGLLPITDFDTLFMDAMSVLVLALLWRRRHAIGDRLPVVIFGMILSAATAVLLGYVVTNFGTLWRMRPMVVVPLWVVGVIALSPRTEAPRESEEVHDAFPKRPSMGAWRLR